MTEDATPPPGAAVRRSHGVAAAATAVALGIALSGCGGSGGGHADSAAAAPPARVEAVPGSQLKRVTLTERAAARLGVATVTVAPVPPDAAGSRGTRSVVPYSAIIYAPDGTTWVFAETEPRSYLREQVEIADVGGPDGAQAFLSSGPPVGTTVVRTGVVEIYGAELGVGE